MEVGLKGGQGENFDAHATLNHNVFTVLWYVVILGDEASRFIPLNLLALTLFQGKKGE